MLIVLAALIPSGLSARDFTYTYEGQTITYTVIDEESRTCATKAGDYDSESNTYVPGNNVSGHLILPTSPIDGGKEYSLTKIGRLSFLECEDLLSVRIPESVSGIGDCAFEGCKHLTSINIPKLVTAIANLTFKGCNDITSIEIPENLRSIGNSAFWDCFSLSTINIPNSVETIESCAFRGCSSLKSINIPDKITRIEDYLFYGCSGLKSISLPDSITSIGELAFFLCSGLEKFHFPKSLTTIWYGAFLHCSGLTELEIPETISFIGNSAFAECENIKTITFPNSITTISGGLLHGCSNLSSINLPKSIQSIEQSAFSECVSLESITLPDSVTTIGERAFEGCTALTSIVIPESVNELGMGALFNTSNLKYVFFKGKQNPAEKLSISYDFDIIPRDIKIYVPGEALDKYSDLSRVGKLYATITSMSIEKTQIVVNTGSPASVPIITYPTVNTDPDYYILYSTDGIVKSSVSMGKLNVNGLKKGNVDLTVISDQPGVESLTISVQVIDGLSGNDIIVKKDPIYVNYGHQMQLNHFIDAGDIQGIASTDWQNYKPSCDNSGVVCGDNYFSIGSSVKDPVTISYTNKEFPDIKFDITVIGKNFTGNLFHEISVYIGQPKPIIIPADYMPLSEFKSIELISDNGEDLSELLNLDVNLEDNAITMTGIKTGNVRIKFTRRYNTGYELPSISVLEMPSLDNFQVLKPNLEIPIGNFVYLSDLVEKGYVEGIPSDYTNYTIESSDRNIAQSDKAGRFIFSKAGTVILTFTHKDFPEISFPIEATARYTCPSRYIQSNLRTLYIGTSQTFIIPDDYLPLSDFDLSIYDSTNSPDAKFEYVVNGNEITITGLRTGSACLQFDYKEVGVVQVLISVVAKPSGNDVKVLKPDIVVPTGFSVYPVYALLNGGVVEGLTGSNGDYKVESSNSSIVTCDSNNGYFRFNSPGTTTITFTNKSVPEETFSIDVTAKKPLQ